MRAEDDTRFICEHRLIAIARLDHPEVAPRLVERLAANHVRIIEVTLTTPNACAVIADLVKRADESGERILVGAGTCTTVEDVSRVVDAGARFVVSPCFFPPMLKAAHAAGVLSIPGCLTPTEVLSAHRAGAHFVKLFPASVGGPGYVRTLRGLFPQVRLIPTGGITLENAGDFLDAGAAAIGVGGHLIPRHAEDDAHLAQIAMKASALVERVTNEPTRRRL